MSDINFEEFLELCEEAGISTENQEVLEQDFRSGSALANVTDALISDQETHPSGYTAGEAIERMDSYITMLDEGEDIEGSRKLATALAVQAIRYLAECLHDEGKN